MRNTWILLLIFPLLLAACKKDPVKLLPKETQKGINKIGAIVDGIVYNTSHSDLEYSLLFCIKKCEFDDDTKVINSLMCQNKKSGGLTINIYGDLIEGKDYAFGENGSVAAHGYITLNNEDGFIYETNYQSTGTLTITKLTSEIISGTFHFTAPASDHQDLSKDRTISITDGRFDIERK